MQFRKMSIYNYCKLFILIFSVFMVFSSISRVDGRHHNHNHQRHHHQKSRRTVPFIPVIPPLPFSSIPCIFPAVHNVSWNFNIKGWPYGKTFRAGDMLAFNYDKDLHNVVSVDEENYRNCSVPTTANVYSSGDDVVMLRPGVNYFICGTMGHCIAGMMIAVTAT